MSQRASTSVPPARRHIMHVVSFICLMAVGLYGAFVAVDRLALQQQSAAALVLDKHYYAPGQTYSTVIINGNRQYSLPQATPETFALKLEIDAREIWAAVPHDLYDALDKGDEVRVGYQRRRLTNAFHVVNVRQ
jgi:hypothetical protein